MANFIQVAKITEITPGTLKTVALQGKNIAIANVDGSFFAIDDTCTHAHCSLGSEGFLEGKVVTCGCHGGRFDVTTGRVLALPAPADVTSYQVKIEGDNVLVGI